MRNLLIDRLLIILFVVIIAHVAAFVAVEVSKVIDDNNQSKQDKPISYPEEIQIAKVGDTLIVSSVSDSIYIGFKNK